MEPGAFIPAHLHKKAAEVLCILEGDFINENKTYGSGDFLHCKPGTIHGPHTTKNGCSFLALYTANTGEADPNDFFLAEAAKRS
jgi:anti-sigma factor ChrR (cupin superfamily)